MSSQTKKTLGPKQKTSFLLGWPRASIAGPGVKPVKKTLGPTPSDMLGQPLASKLEESVSLSKAFVSSKTGLELKTVEEYDTMHHLSSDHAPGKVVLYYDEDDLGPQQ